MIKNEKGSILVITSGFVLAFTMLGLAGLYMAGQENEMADRLRASTQALWLAEAGIERTRATFPVTPPTSEQNLGLGTYQATSTTVNSGKWTVTSKGMINLYTGKDSSASNQPQVRTIQATLATYTISDAIKSEDFLRCNNSYDINQCKAFVNGPISQLVSVKLGEVFKGLTENNVISAATSTNTKYNYDDYVASPSTHPIKNVTVIDATTTDPSNNSPTPIVEINTDSFTGTEIPFLYIRANDSIRNIVPTIKFTGSKPFNGVLWVNVSARANISQTSGFNGTIFIQGDGNAQNELDSTDLTKKIIYDETVVDKAIANLGNFWTTNSRPTIVDWKEL